MSTHTGMPAEGHDTESLDCWCWPRLFVWCVVCKDRSERCGGCDRNALVELTREQAEEEEAEIVVIHNDI